MQKGISQKVKPGASPAEQTMRAVAVQMMKTSVDYTPTYPLILVSIAVKLISDVLSLIMCVVIRPVI